MEHILHIEGGEQDWPPAPSRYYKKRFKAYPKTSGPGSHARLTAAWKPPLLEFSDRFLRRLLAELRGLQQIMYDIYDEPDLMQDNHTIKTDSQRVIRWVQIVHEEIERR